MAHDGPPRWMAQWATWRADGSDESPDTVHHTVGAQRDKGVFFDEVLTDPSLKNQVDGVGDSRGRMCRGVEVDESATIVIHAAVFF